MCLVCSGEKDIILSFFAVRKVPIPSVLWSKGGVAGNNSHIFQGAHHLGPATDFYKKLALDCSGQQIGVDLFLLSSQYADLASLGESMIESAVGIFHVVHVSKVSTFLLMLWMLMSESAPSILYILFFFILFFFYNIFPFLCRFVNVDFKSDRFKITL